MAHINAVTVTETAKTHPGLGIFERLPLSWRGSDQCILLSELEKARDCTSVGRLQQGFHDVTLAHGMTLSPELRLDGRELELGLWREADRSFGPLGIYCFRPSGTLRQDALLLRS